MMKRKINWLEKITVAFVIVFFVLSGSLMAAQIISKTNDAAIAFRVYNGYPTGVVTWVVKASTIAHTNLVGCQGHTNTYISTDALTNGTITLLVANGRLATNAAGTASLIIDADPSLSGDSVTNNLLAGSYSAQPGEWLDVLWDTDRCKFYSIYFPSRTYQAGAAAYVLERVGGLPGGTGNVTASIYKSGVLINQKVIVSPTYSQGLTANYASVVTNVADNVVSLDWVLNMPFTGRDAVIVRAERATTATTGVLVGVIPNQ